MREIKFRGYDGMDWIYSMSIDYEKETDIWYMLDYKHDEWLMVGNIGQYTGLKDVEGKDVFEGDICELRTGYGMYGEKGIVGFEDGEFYFTNLQEGFYGEFKIIGNIYDNPELLDA